ncbi:HutD/Ves family protein [Aminipila luticellarii]|uniref:Protein Ves n=1 Tax=Aminipila luticellarii TaxID=2507160 RepID=A0A410PWN9_9FIRM|nr:HutD family protein [Aminipila luticellarii]QAT43362.1 hypothetical protein EQM06_09110 [Aminipila luticellarii]
MNHIECKAYKKEEYKEGKWSGGTTTELAIYPKNSVYSDRNFIWRLSSATVELEESDFTPLPDYDRILIVLRGEAVLSHKEVRVIRLAAYEQDRFSGSYQTRSFGQITDFNLMVRKGNQGFAEVMTVTGAGTAIPVESWKEYHKMSQSFFCAEGFCTIYFNKRICQLNAGELLVINCDSGDITKLRIMGKGKIIRTHMYYNE